MRLTALLVFVACSALTVSAARAADGVRRALEGSVSISASDSIVSLTRLSSTRLGVDLIDRDSDKKHFESAELSPETMQTVLEAAAIEGLAVAVEDPEALAPPPPKPKPSVSRPVQRASSRSENSTRSKPSYKPPPGSPFANADQNRLTYLGYQTALSTYVYGLSIPLAFGVTEPRFLIASPLITAPLAFGAHLFFANKMEFDEAHLKGTVYTPSIALYAATALPLAFTGDFGDGYRIASLLGAAVYPLSVWYGYHLGDVYKSNPDQLDLKFKFALGYAFLGFVTPTLYFENSGQHSEETLRLALGQSAIMAGVGGVVADYYQPHPSDGVKLGVVTQSVLGGLAGLEVAAITDASSAKPWIGAAVFGTSLGFTGSVFFFHSSNDNFDRARYSAIGSLGGAMVGTGVQLLFDIGSGSDRAQEIAWFSAIVGGAWLGYWSVYELTSQMVEAPRTGTHGSSSSALSPWAFNPLPVLEPVMSRGDVAMRWKIPGISRHF